MRTYVPEQPAGRWAGNPESAPSLPRVNWWLRLTSSGWDRPQRTIQERELARRSRLTSWIILGLFVVDVLLLLSGVGDAPTLITALVFGGSLVFIGVFNRSGLVSLAGAILVLLIIAAAYPAM